jgi:hypothetical protein
MGLPSLGLRDIDDDVPLAAELGDRLLGMSSALPCQFGLSSTS